MKSSSYEKIYSLLKSQFIITIGATIFLTVLVAIHHSTLITLWGNMIGQCESWCEKHPFVLGVMISWLAAISSIFIVSYFAYRNRDKKEQYNKIFRQSEKWLRGITMVVLFYLAIHLASKAFWKKGIPIFGEPYPKHGFFNCISLQDIFLFSFVFFTIILLFWIAPYVIDKRKNIVHILLSISLVLSIIASCIPFFVPVNESNTEPSLKDPSYLFSWDDVPGNESENLLKYLQTDHNIDWTKSAEISKSDDGKVIYIVKDEKSAEIIIDTEEEKATLIISNGGTHNLKVKKEDDKLNIYKSEGDWRSFAIIFVLSLILYLLIRKVKEIPKGIKDDYKDLWLIFCFLPAIIVASLVLAGDELVKFPNVFSNLVVGLVLISGFATLMSMVTISFKQGAVKPWCNPILLRSTFASLAAISGFSTFFLLLRHFFKIDIAIFGKALSFSVAIMIVILLYGFLYEKLLRYQFTEWWRRESKPIAMIVSILLIAIVTAIDPKPLLVWKIPIKLVFIVVALFIAFSLPWIPMVLRRFNKLFNKLTNKKLTFKAILELCTDLPKILKEVKEKTMHQGMVLVKADPASLKEVVKGLDGMEGVYQTMVVRGEYDVCLIIEGLDYYEIEKKISEIRKIDGVADTTTLRDIREFFDREVR